MTTECSFVPQQMKTVNTESFPIVPLRLSVKKGLSNFGSPEKKLDLNDHAHQDSLEKFTHLPHQSDIQLRHRPTTTSKGYLEP
jgi:hypothetical protein